jgi:hypothetical protein
MPARNVLGSGAQDQAVAGGAPGASPGRAGCSKLFQLLTYTAAGTPGEVSDYLEGFLQHTGADELITAHHALTIEARLRSVTLLAEAMQTVTA